MSTTPFSLAMTQTGDTRLNNASASGKNSLQLTDIVLGNPLTSRTNFKQATQVRNEVYRVPLNRVAVDTTKNLVVCEWIVPEDKKNTRVHEIGVFEYDTLVAIGYSSSPLSSIVHGRGPLTQKVHIQIDNPASLSAIEEVTNLINIKNSDSRYLNAADNLKDLDNNQKALENLGLGTPEKAQTTLELGTAALKNWGTGDTDLITRSDADNLYLNLKNSENLFSNKADKKEVSKLTQFLSLIFGDIDALNYLLQLDLTNDQDQIEAWFGRVDNKEKLTAIADSPKAMNAIADSPKAMNAIATSAVALNAIVKSQLACAAIETALQSHRSTVHHILNTAPANLFTKQSGVNIGNGLGSWDDTPNTKTIYIPTAYYDDTYGNGDYAYFSVHSLLSGKQLVNILRRPGTKNVTTGIALRGVRATGRGITSVGNVTVAFDVFTAL